MNRKMNDLKCVLVWSVYYTWLLFVRALTYASGSEGSWEGRQCIVALSICTYCQLTPMQPMKLNKINRGYCRRVRKVNFGWLEMNALANVLVTMESFSVSISGVSGFVFTLLLTDMRFWLPYWCTISPTKQHFISGPADFQSVRPCDDGKMYRNQNEFMRRKMWSALAQDRKFNPDDLDLDHHYDEHCVRVCVCTFDVVQVTRHPN